MIKDLREQKGESLRSAARNIGIDVAHLARVESGEKQLSSSLSDRISDYYDVDPDEVYLASRRLPPDIVSISGPPGGARHSEKSTWLKWLRNGPSSRAC